MPKRPRRRKKRGRRSSRSAAATNSSTEREPAEAREREPSEREPSEAAPAPFASCAPTRTPAQPPAHPFAQVSTRSTDNYFSSSTFVFGGESPSIATTSNNNLFGVETPPAELAPPLRVIYHGLSGKTHARLLETPPPSELSFEPLFYSTIANATSLPCTGQPTPGYRPVRDVGVWEIAGRTCDTMTIGSMRCEPMDACLNIVRRCSADVVVGFELEFQLLPNYSPPGVSIGRLDPHGPMPHGYASAGALYVYQKFIETLRKKLKECGVVVVQIHAEAGPGQLEIVLPPHPAEVACARLIFTKECVRSAALATGFVSCFISKRRLDEPGNGLHVNVSPSGDTPWNTKEAAARLVAAIDELIVFTTATSHVGYDRFTPNAWAGCEKRWNWADKEAPIRAVGTDPSIPPRRIEIKCCDPACNVYVAVAAICSLCVGSWCPSDWDSFSEPSLNGTRLNSFEESLKDSPRLDDLPLELQETWKLLQEMRCLEYDHFRMVLGGKRDVYVDGLVEKF